MGVVPRPGRAVAVVGMGRVLVEVDAVVVVAEAVVARDLEPHVVERAGAGTRGRVAVARRIERDVAGPPASGLADVTELPERGERLPHVAGRSEDGADRSVDEPGPPHVTLR